MKKSIMVLVGLGALVATGAAMAAGNAAAGKSAAVACAGCHGAGGNSTNPAWPKLAGQHAGYVAKQLADFKSGARKDPMMAGMAAPLSKKQMEDIGAWYSTEKVARIGARNAELARQGEMLYRGGNSRTQVGACMGCHGPAGQGIPPNYPSVSGQHASYTETQLLAFKNGTRKNDNGVMQGIAFRMSLQEIKAVAAYMEGLSK
jgi:cytochrome c553